MFYSKIIFLLFLLILISGCGSVPCAAHMTVQYCFARNGSGSGGSGSATGGNFSISGGIDTAFGGGGTGFNNTTIGTSATAYGVVKQSDGKIVVVGYDNSIGDNNHALVRYYSNGVIDTTYGTAGITSTDFFGNSNDIAYAAVIQSNDFVLSVGSTDTSTPNYSCIVARYNTSGALDTNFNGAGPVPGTQSSKFGGTNTYCYGAALQTDGKVVVVGNASFAGERPAVGRFTTTGALDASTTIDLGATAPNTFKAVTILADGSIVATGYVTTGATTDTFIAKFNSSLALDSSFGGGGTGYNTFDAGGAVGDRGNSIVADSSGNFYVGGYTTAGADQFMVVKFNSMGIVDTTYGTAGVATFNVTAGSDQGNAIGLQLDGKIVVGGMAGAAAAAHNFTLVRFLSTGLLDTAFGTAGAFQIDTSGVANQDIMYGLLVYDSTSIIGVGTAKIGAPYKFSIAKFQ